MTGSVTGELQYHPDGEQLALAAEFGAALRDGLPHARLHRAAAESDEIWAELTSLGLFSITRTPAAGGSGLGLVEEAMILLEFAPALPSAALVATLGAAPFLDAADPRTAAGYRDGGRIIALDPEGASWLLVRDGDNAALHPLSGATQRQLDARYWLGSVCEVTDLSPPVATLDRRDCLRLRLLDSAALAGAATAATTMAVAYAGIRQQFGREIGSFQAVKHHCANMAIAARCARDQLGFAAVALAEGRADAAFQVESALLVAADAALDNAGKNIQIHGGIGFSDEADPHLVLKRAQALLAVAGGRDAAIARLCAIGPIL